MAGQEQLKACSLLMLALLRTGGQPADCVLWATHNTAFTQERLPTERQKHIRIRLLLFGMITNNIIFS